MTQNSKEEQLKGKWMTYKQACDIDGSELINEYMSADPPTIEFKRNPKLPKESKIPYPHNQVLRYVVEQSKDTKRATNVEMLGSEYAVGPDDQDEAQAFTVEFNKIRSGGSRAYNP